MGRKLPSWIRLSEARDAAPWIERLSDLMTTGRITGTAVA
jgi:hypothetical protein